MFFGFSDYLIGCPMKVRASVRRICDKCKLIKRKGVVRVICEDPRHKQRPGINGSVQFSVFSFPSKAGCCLHFGCVKTAPAEHSY